MSGAEAAPRILELLDVAKHFGGVQALEGVTLSVGRGSVHALVGENGAGKSTLGRIVAGALTPDAGTCSWRRAAVSFRSPREALEHGVAAIAQEPSLVPQLTVAENVFLGVEPRRAGFLRRRSLSRDYAALARSAGFDLPGRLSAGRLRTSEQQKVEILRALSRDAQLIVMDEPSAALSAHETRQLHAIIRSLSASGKTILLISHFLREVLELADTVTVLRDGALIRTSPAAAETEASLVEAMLGRPLTAAFPGAAAAFSRRAGGALGPRPHGARRGGGVLRPARGRDPRSRRARGRRAARSSRARSSAPRRLQSGDVALRGRAARAQPAAEPRVGAAMIPESRKDDGLILGRSSIENATLSAAR